MRLDLTSPSFKWIEVLDPNGHHVFALAFDTEENWVDHIISGGTGLLRDEPVEVARVHYEPTVRALPTAPPAAKADLQSRYGIN